MNDLPVQGNPPRAKGAEEQALDAGDTHCGLFAVPERAAPSEWNADWLRIFAGPASTDLADKIARYLGVSLGEANVHRFPDGEVIVQIEDDVRGRDCFVIQSTCPPVNEHLMELLIFIDCLRRASARRITAVIPYYGYARQDRKSEGRTPITAKLVANLIVEAGADRVLTMDLHADQIQGFFDVPVDHLTAEPVITRFIEGLQLRNIVLVAADVGHLKKIKRYVARLDGELAIIDKRRTSGTEAVAETVIGDIRGKTVLMFDDMVTTAGTACDAARLLREHGAKEIYFAVTHAVLAEPAYERLSRAGFRMIIVTDTIPIPPERRRQLPNLQILSVAELMGEAIRRIHNNESISALFEPCEPPSTARRGH